MRLQVLQRPRPSPARLTAMVDVVFLLIIFFMTVSQLNSDINEELPLPLADQGKLVKDRQGRFVINVRADGGIVVFKKTIPANRMQELLRDVVKRDGAEAVKVILRVDRGTPFIKVQEAMASLAEIGIWRLAYSVVERD